MRPQTKMFLFLELVILDDPEDIAYLRSQGFTEEDDIMRILDVKTEELPAHVRIVIDDLKEEARKNDLVPRIFLGDVMNYLDRSKNYKRKCAELEEQLEQLELSNSLHNGYRDRALETIKSLRDENERLALENKQLRLQVRNTCSQGVRNEVQLRRHGMNPQDAHMPNPYTCRRTDSHSGRY